MDFLWASPIPIPFGPSTRQVLGICNSEEKARTTITSTRQHRQDVVKVRSTCWCRTIAMIVWYSLMMSDDVWCSDVMWRISYLDQGTGQLGWLVAKRAKSTLHVRFLGGFKSLSKTRWYLPVKPDRRQMFSNHEIVCSGSCGSCIQFWYRDTSEGLVLLRMHLASQVSHITSSKYSASHVLAVACGLQKLNPARFSIPRVPVFQEPNAAARILQGFLGIRTGL